MAEEIVLKQSAVEDLLVGKTIKGLHFGAETRQCFAPSGLTLWIKDGDEAPSEARYKIEEGKYCSSWTGLWNKEDYNCFSIAHDEAQNVHYFRQDDFRAPFIVMDEFNLRFDFNCQAQAAFQRATVKPPRHQTPLANQTTSLEPQGPEDSSSHHRPSNQPAPKRLRRHCPAC